MKYMTGSGLSTEIYEWFIMVFKNIEYMNGGVLGIFTVRQKV
jgi:hypothetical protein